MSVVRLVGRGVLWLAGGLALGIALALVVPLAFDGRPYTVLSGSMEPAISTGDVVVATRIAPLDARPGDVVTFRDPDDSGKLITHRVRDVGASGGKVQFVTKGDANNATERWRVSASGQISQVRYRVPFVGRLALFAQTRTGLVAADPGPADAAGRPRNRADLAAGGGGPRWRDCLGPSAARWRW